MRRARYSNPAPPAADGKRFAAGTSRDTASISSGTKGLYADETAPGAHFGDWSSNAEFFARGRLDEWVQVLNESNQALYRDLAPKKVEPRLLAWLEGGRAAAEPLG